VRSFKRMYAIVGVLVTLSAGACTRTGRGTVTGAPPSAAPVALHWQSGFDAGTGELRMELAGGRVYSGPFAQIRADLGTQLTGPTFLGWSIPRWAEHPWYGGPPREITGANTPKLVAMLEDDRGQVARCRVMLQAPDRGLAGGGEGVCLLPDGHGEVTVALPAE
jgi:hypothetical protein